MRGRAFVLLLCGLTTWAWLGSAEAGSRAEVGVLAGGGDAALERQAISIVGQRLQEFGFEARTAGDLPTLRIQGQEKKDRLLLACVLDHLLRVRVQRGAQGLGTLSVRWSTSAGLLAQEQVQGDAGGALLEDGLPGLLDQLLPTVQAELSQRQVQVPRRVALEVSSPQPGAWLQLSRKKPRAPSPLQVTLPSTLRVAPGAVTLKVQAPGFQPQLRQLRVNQAQRVTVALQPLRRAALPVSTRKPRSKPSPWFSPIELEDIVTMNLLFGLDPGKRTAFTVSEGLSAPTFGNQRLYWTTAQLGLALDVFDAKNVRWGPFAGTKLGLRFWPAKRHELRTGAGPGMQLLFEDYETPEGTSATRWKALVASGLWEVLWIYRLEKGSSSLIIGGGVEGFVWELDGRWYTPFGGAFRFGATF